MEFLNFNFLATTIDVFKGFGQPYNLNWIGNIIKWFIEIFGNIGIGVIMFTVALKLITLPLDIFSRASMKKSSLKMEEMRPQLEKLKRQYANNTQLYNQKIQALYKKQGYSMFASCLPTLITLIFFIVVINQFSTYSNYTNLNMLNDMASSYTQSIEQMDETVVIKEEIDGENKYYLNQSYIFDNDEGFSHIRTFIKKTEGEKAYNPSYEISDLKAFAEYVKSIEGYSTVKVGTAEQAKEETIHVIEENGDYSFNKENYLEGTSEEIINREYAELVMNDLFNDYALTNVKSVARESAKQTYESKAPEIRFLWVKNIWMSDLPYKHPVNSSLSGYEFYNKLAVKDNDQFVEITANLTKEKSTPNGYFILVVLSIVTMLLSQLIMQKSQKTQMELQSNDGTAMQTQKMMMWMMPIMFGFFAFMYSASFSIYMTVSTVLSSLSTVVINFFVEKSFNKKNKKETK
ncbi:MAG: YidC/Oxa1 family membrane protein insertase [Christensenellaceae bacterium]